MDAVVYGNSWHWVDAAAGAKEATPRTTPENCPAEDPTDPLSDVVDVANRRRFPGQNVGLLDLLGLVGLAQ